MSQMFDQPGAENGGEASFLLQKPLHFIMPGYLILQLTAVG